jgi:hypothetical protein
LSSASIFRSFLAFWIGLFVLSLQQLTADEQCCDGLPNISTRSQPCCSNWSISGDFLAWFASEEVASIWADVITIGFDTSTWHAPSFNFKWDYGFRVGIGYDLIYDQWDTQFYWTSYRTEAKHTIPFASDAIVSAEFDAAFLSDDGPQSIRAKWSLFFNMFDWELGRSFWVSKYLSLRPFIGLKGGWINQPIHVDYFNLAIGSVLTSNSGQEHLKNNFWGIGPSGGVNTKWNIRTFNCQSFGFCGDFSLATMWGTWHCNDKYENTLFATSTVHTKKSTLGSLMLRGFLGLIWDADIHRCRFSTKLGYEMQIWFNQLRLATFQVQRLHNDLTLQGVTFHCQLDF